MHALKALWPGNPLKRWLGSQPSEGAKPAAAPTPAPATTKAPAPAARVQAPNGTAPKAPQPAPVQAMAEDKLLRLPLKPIFDRLSPALAALANAEQISDTDEIALQLDNILAQLPGGVVRISFGELRNAAPAGIFGEQTSHDYTLIDVPLSEIVARINPAMLSLRNDRKKVEVPQEVLGVFGKNGSGTAVIAAMEPLPAPTRETKPAVAPAAPVAPAMPTPPARARVNIPPPPPGGDIIQFTRPAPAAAPAPAPAESAPIPMAPQVQVKPAEPMAPVVAPSAPIPMPTMAKAAAPAPAATPVVAAAPAKPEPQVDPLVVPLASLMENWPAAIKAEVEQGRPAVSGLAIPMSRLEGPMKTGKLTFRWSELRQWTKPAPMGGNSAHGDTDIQLALNVIAPLFFAHPSRTNVAKKKAEIAQDIPDVFGSTSAAQAVRELAAVPITKVTAAPAPVAPAAPEPVLPSVAAQGGSATNLQLRMNGNGTAPVAQSRAPELTENAVLFSKKPTGDAPAAAVNGGNGNGHVANNFPKLEWTPDQTVKVTCACPAVAGALVVAADGLMVATQLPPQFKSDVLSAFVPQIFGRAAQSAADLQLPALNSVRLSFGDQQCEIFKTGKVYYVIVGKPGEELPTPFLRKVAAELTKRN